MAGIGFELKKLFLEQEKLFGNVKALVFSAAISVGPWIITSTSLNLLILISKSINLSRQDQTLFMSSIFYAFIFSQILTGAFQYLITRYVSDCIFQEKIHKIRSSFLGSIKSVGIVSFFISLVFINRGHLTPAYKATFILLFVSMCLSWITMIFVSLLKKYHFIIFSFFLGNAISVILGYYFLKYPVSFIKETPTFWMLFSYSVGIFLNFILTSMYILRAFQGKGRNQFEFLTYLKGYFSLVLIGILYILGVWGHVFMNWVVGDSYLLANVFIISPLYEVAVFYSYCTAIPSIIYFTIFLETKFLPIYKEYYSRISQIGRYEEIQDSLKRMKQILYQEILYSMELQFLISLTFILLSNVIFNYFDMDSYLLDLFRITIFGTFCAIFISILITLFLYFDLRIQSLILSSTLLVTSLAFTYLFGKLGKEFTGTGFFLSSFISFGLAVYMFPKLFDTLNYTTMFRQNFNYKVGGVFLKKMTGLLDKKLYIVIIVLLLFILGSCNVQAATYDKRGFNLKTKNNWHTMSQYDSDGYDIDGYTRTGINKRGFNRQNINFFTKTPYDYAGFDYTGIHKDTKKPYDERGFDVNLHNVITNSPYDINGFDHAGIHKNTKREYDENGWNYYGLHEKTKDYYNPEGWNVEGINKRGFNREGWNIETKSKFDGGNFDFNGIHKNTKKPYDERGFDINRYNHFTNSYYDKYGFDYEGINKDTKREYDKNGWTYYGLHEKTKTYYNPQGYNREGFDKEGYKKGQRPKNLYDEEYDKKGFNKKGIYIKGY